MLVDVKPTLNLRLLVELEMFAPHVRVSAAVCNGGKGHLHFVKVIAVYYLLSAKTVAKTGERL